MFGKLVELLATLVGASMMGKPLDAHAVGLLKATGLSRVTWSSKVTQGLAVQTASNRLCSSLEVLSTGIESSAVASKARQLGCWKDIGPAPSNPTVPSCLAYLNEHIYIMQRHMYLSSSWYMPRV